MYLAILQFVFEILLNIWKMLQNLCLDDLSLLFFSLIHQNSLNPNSGYSQNRSLLYYMKTQVVSNVQRIKEISHKRYQSRISAVKNFCANKRYKISKVERNNAANLTTRWRQEMWWDIRNGFAWCCVYKVASSSLGNFKAKNKFS